MIRAGVKARAEGGRHRMSPIGGQKRTVSVGWVHKRAPNGEGRLVAANCLGLCNLSWLFMSSDLPCVSPLIAYHRASISVWHFGRRLQ
jgi:hypothetical protein